jgi:hypothetical protein
LECQYVPIRWIWYDCGDNSLVTRFRDSLLISRNIFDDGNTNIANAHDSLLYPTYYGAQDTDCGLTNSNMTIARSLDLYNGGFRFACPETLDARGDINLNGIPFEIADAVRYSNYFLYGQSAFSETTPFPLSATDVNGDGVPLTLADLVYFIRVVVGDARPPQELDTVEIDYTFEDDMVSVRLPIGAAYFNVVGDVNPTSYTSAQVRYAYDSSADLTKVLVYSMKVGNEIQGDFIRIPGDILYVEMATYDGAPVLAKRIHIPDGFVLLQNYPNPFNSSTVFSFGLPTPSDYKLTIYNTTGQLLETQTGTSEAGMVSLTWDAGEYASGVYFYRLQVGDFSETRKMVLLK